MSSTSTADAVDKETNRNDGVFTEEISDEEQADTANRDDDAVEEEEEEMVSENEQDERWEKAQLLKADGNERFKQGDWDGARAYYALAIEAAKQTKFNEERCVYHANRAACYVKMSQWQEAVDDCTAAIKFNPKFIKAYMRRAQANEELEHFQAALDDYTKVGEIDPNNKHARQKCMSLPAKVAEQQERQKEEMLGKLKEMGNSILGKFGLSLDSFNAVKDPETGSYSVSFGQPGGGGGGGGGEREEEESE